MTKEGSALIVNFITIDALSLMLGRGNISHYCEYALSFTLSIYLLIVLVLREYNAAFLCHCWSLFFYNGTADMQYRVSATQVTGKALGPLICFFPICVFFII